MKKYMIFTAFFFPVIAYAAGCEEYPYTDGVNIEDVAGGTKMLATASATVSFDDPASIRDAKDEATLLAKAQISSFLSENISSDEAIEKAVNETKSMSGNEKSAERKEVIERVKSLRNSTQALLRGVVVLGDCYTKGSEVRVSVGIKPETINSAGNIASGMTESIKNSPSSETDKSGEVGSSQGVGSYSNTKRLQNF